MKPQAVIFDLDETLAASKQPITPAIADLLTRLLAQVPVGIASGGKIEVLMSNCADALSDEAKERLYLLPTNGAALYRFRSGVRELVYEERLSPEEGEVIKKAIEEAVAETGLIDPALPTYGDLIEYRGSQVTLSARGQTAPIEEKVAWDPERTKRPVLREAIANKLPNYSVRTGGATSFDITRPGIDKAFGVLRLSEYLSIPVKDMLYVGDALFPGGNDEVVKDTDIETRQVAGPEETAEVISQLLLTVYER